MLWVVIGLVGTLYYMGHQLVTAKSIAIVAVMGAMVVFATVSRNGGNEKQRTIGDAIGSLMINRQGPDIAVTSHIVEGIPHKLEYMHGKTMAVWLIAPVPRELMPNKPLIHSGPIIGQNIYGLRVSGVPPGIVAELYWNFHYAGVIFGCILFGGFMRYSYEFCRCLVIDSVLIVPVYLFGVFPIAFKAATNSLGPALVMQIVNLATICVIAYFVSVRAERIAPQPMVPVNSEMPNRPLQSV